VSADRHRLHPNRRNTNKTWTRHNYPLTPVLRCGRCGSTMHGEVASDASGSRRYYACHAARRQRAATRLPLARRDARAIRSERIEEAIRQELGRCLPSDDVQAAYRAELERAIETPPHPRDVREGRCWIVVRDEVGRRAILRVCDALSGSAHGVEIDILLLLAYMPRCPPSPGG
jgi:hypothetical protein